MGRWSRLSQVAVALLAGGAIMLAVAPPALACGGLVAPDGAVRLDDTTTLAAYHDGIEHYVTSFQYAGGSTSFGSIIPLPAVPTDVRRAGSWTLQRLEREVHPQPPVDRDIVATASAANVPAAQVLFQTTVDALDITVLKGGGAQVIDWVKAHGYAVSNDAPAMLDFYAQRSPIFLAARFDASKAAALGQQAGDGTPIEITIPTARPWVPVHILTLAKVPEAPVVADVFLLTDQPPALLGLDRGVTVDASEPASASLLADLHSDRNSQWIPRASWLTYIHIDSLAAQLTHDLAIDPSGAGRPSAIEAGYQKSATAPAPATVGLDPISQPLSPGNPHAFILATALAALIVIVLAGWTVATYARRPRT